MSIREVNLYIRHEFSLPDVYTKGTLEDIEEALWIGATIQQSIHSRRSGEEVQKIIELKDAEIGRITASYNEKLTGLLGNIQTVMTEKDAIEASRIGELKGARDAERILVGREWEEKMRLWRKEHDGLIGRHLALEAQLKELEEGRTRDIQAAVKRTEDIMEKLVTSKQEQLIRVESAYSRLNEVISKQAGEITKLTTVLGKRHANIKAKGSDYEELIYEKLKRYYGLCRGFELAETRLGAGHEMDFSMGVEGHVVMWEVKNYTTTVPKAEVDKFLRDLKENPQARIGIMLSRSTDIYGKNYSGGLLTEFLDDKMMIYINRFEEFCGEDEGRVFQMLMALFRVWWEYHNDRNDGSSFDREGIIRELERAVEDISKRRTEWRRHKMHLEEIGRWTYDLLDESEGRLDRLLKKARMEVTVVAGTAGTAEAAETEKVAPEGVFREGDGERERIWIQSIMKVCEEGGQIEVRELVDLLGAHHKLSKDTIRSNIMGVICDKAIIKRGVVKYIKGISKVVPKCEIRI